MENLQKNFPAQRERKNNFSSQILNFQNVMFLNRNGNKQEYSTVQPGQFQNVSSTRHSSGQTNFACPLISKFPFPAEAPRCSFTSCKQFRKKFRGPDLKRQDWENVARHLRELICPSRCPSCQIVIVIYYEEQNIMQMAKDKSLLFFISSFSLSFLTKEENVYF